MKKSILSVIAVISTIFSINATCISASFTAYDDGEYYGKITLQSNCRFTISTVDNEYFVGTYTIDAEDGLKPGAEYWMTFTTSDGNRYTAKFMWGMYDGQSILLDNFLFRKDER